MITRNTHTARAPSPSVQAAADALILALHDQMPEGDDPSVLLANACNQAVTALGRHRGALDYGARFGGLIGALEAQLAGVAATCSEKAVREIRQSVGLAVLTGEIETDLPADAAPTPFTTAPTGAAS